MISLSRRPRGPNGASTAPMKITRLSYLAQILLVLSLMCLSISPSQVWAGKSQHLLYVASPGVRDYVQYGGVGILVFDIDHGYRFVRRIPTWEFGDGEKAENVKGIAASAATGTVYVTDLHRVIAIDAVTGKKLWDKPYQGGCDRLAISPDGKLLYVPQFEGPSWHVVDAATGDVIATIETGSGSHNTIYFADGAHVYLAGLKSPVLSVVDAKTQKVVSTVGPFSNSIRRSPSTDATRWFSSTSTVCWASK